MKKMKARRKRKKNGELLHKRMIAQDRAQIRLSTRRALFSTAILILAFIGFYLMDEGMPISRVGSNRLPAFGVCIRHTGIGISNYLLDSRYIGPVIRAQ